MSTLATLRDIHGRGMNTKSDVYKLPADIQEMDRLTLQHRMWCLMMGNLCPVPIDQLQETLRSRVGNPPAVLDLGCGSGIWCVEMAEAFPHARVVGFDLSECKPKYVPSNCSFVQGDWSQGLADYKGQFDLVYTRSVIGHLTKEMQQTAVKQAVDCVRPGGLIVLSDGDHIVLDVNKEPAIPAVDGDTDPSHSWFARFMYKINSLTWQLDGCLGQEFGGWLRSNDKIETDTVSSAIYYSPVGWDGAGMKYGDAIGHMMSTNIQDFTRAWRPLFKTKGLPEEEVEQLIRNVDQEVRGPRIRLFLRWHASWGRKL